LSSPPTSALFPYTTLFRSSQDIGITPLGENGVVPWIKKAFLKAAQAAEEARRGPARKNAGGVVPARRLLCTPEWVGQAAIRRRAAPNHPSGDGRRWPAGHPRGCARH